MPRNQTPLVGPAAKRTGLSVGLTVSAVAGALALLGAFLASGDAHAQSAPAGPMPVELSQGGPGIESAISVSAQVSLVWRQETGIKAAVTNYSDSGTGEAATAEHIFEVMQKAAITALGEAAAAGARTGHVDVVATVYRFDTASGAISNWAPVGVFIDTTDMAVGDDGKANFHTHGQFIPDASQQVQPAEEAPAPGQ